MPEELKLNWFQKILKFFGLLIIKEVEVEKVVEKMVYYPIGEVILKTETDKSDKIVFNLFMYTDDYFMTEIYEKEGRKKNKLKVTSSDYKVEELPEYKYKFKYKQRE